VFKEGFQKRIDEIILRSRQLGPNRGLGPEGKPHFGRFVQDYKNGKQILFYRYIHMLDGYDYTSNIHGLDNLERIKNEQILVVANHPYQDPLKGGHCQRILINHNVYNMTQKETRWLFGGDKKSPEYLMRKRFFRQSSLILVRDDDPQASGVLIRQAFKNKDAMGINPEGNGNKSLLKASPKAGKMIIAAATHKYNIVCIATDFKNGKFFMAVDAPLDNMKILGAAMQFRHDQDRLQELLADYCMARVARLLPQEKRGYYSDFQKFIDAFESLIVEKT